MKNKNLKILSIIFCLLLIGGSFYVYYNIPINLFLEDKFKTYPMLYDGLQSENYELVQLTDIIHSDFEIEYEPQYQNYIFRVESKYNEYGFTYYRINNKGIKTDSLEIENNYLSDAGLFILNYQYIDWALTGDTTVKEFSNKLELTPKNSIEINQYFKEAKRIGYKMDYDNDVVLFHILMPNDEWWLVSSSDYFKKAMNGELTFPNKPTLEKIEFKPRGFYNWKDPASPFVLQGFEKKSRTHTSFLDINNHSRSGWQGMGYFRTNFNNESITFKKPCFMDFGSDEFAYDPGISFFASDHHKEILLLNITGTYGESRLDIKSPTGMFVLRKK